MGEVLSVPDQFLEVLATVGAEHPAFVDSSGVLTYHQLDRDSASLAAEITRRLGRGTKEQQRPIALFLPHSAHTFTGILGVLRTGHFYLPLDTSQTAEFLNQVLQDCPPALLITTTEFSTKLSGFAGVPDLLLLDRLEESSWTRMPVDGACIAGLLYTSGSTGTPRGVMRPHASFVLPGLYGSLGERLPPERVASLSSYAVAASGRSIIGVLMSGSTAFGGVLKDMSTRELCDWLVRHRIQTFLCPPGIFRTLGAQEDVFFPELRTVSVSMESIARKDVEAFGKRVSPGTNLVFTLAATECASVTSFVVKNGEPWFGERTPAGYPLRGVHVEIVDEELKPVPTGTTGQIVVSTPTMSLGYWNRPAENEKKFGTDSQGRRICFTGDLGCLSEDGLLEHRGRIDFMMKIRGFRVEPYPIEAMLMDHPGVSEAVVTAVKDKHGNARLFAYYQAKDGAATSPAELRDYLSARRVSHEIPSRFIGLDSFPRLGSGKIDRKSLPPPGKSRPELANAYAAPRNDQERVLVDLWSELLDLDEVGVDDDFFQLGGDSLTALEMTYRVERLGIAIPEGFFDDPTISSFTPSQGPASESRVSRRNREPKLTIRGPLRALRQTVLGLYTAASWGGLGPAFYRAFAKLAAVGATMLLVFSDKLSTFRRNYTELAVMVGAPSPRRVVHHWVSILGIQTIWGLFLDKLLPRDLARLSVIQGSDLLAAARAENRPVIIVCYHTPIHRLTKRLFDLLGYPSAGIFPPPMDPSSRARSAANNTQVLKRAEEALRRGEIVRIFPDGEKGTRSVVKDFLGVPREFFPGFAELASRENAKVVAMGATMGTDGSLTLRIGPVFDDDRQATHDARVLRLQEQYVAYLESQWKADPANVNPKYVREFLALRDGYSAVR